MICAAAWLPAHAQEPAPPAPAPRFEDTVEVVAVTPVHGVGLPARLVPANIQVIPAAGGYPLDAASTLLRQGGSVHLNEVQGGAFQPDVLFRGFSASPLLGASEGVAIYQDGVRLNDPFGDVVAWDTLPSSAVAAFNIIPGSNPLFGLNALGGALSLRTKDGHAFPGERVLLTTGSFGRHRVEAESGGSRGAFAYYAAAELAHEDGWRDFSPSTVRRLFTNVGVRGVRASADISVTAASNDLTGNGTAPVQLLAADRSAVFTHPDLTQNDLLLVTGRLRRQVSPLALAEGVAYVRRMRSDTFNGDAADDDDDDEGDEGDEGDEDDEDAFDAVNNMGLARAVSFGGTAQITRTAPLGGRDNHFIAGGGVDVAAPRFTFAAELARLTPDRGTTRGSGLFEEEVAVDLRTRRTSGGLFLMNTWSATSALAVTGSARVDWTSVRLRDQLGDDLTGDHRFWRLNPSAGVTYQIARAVNVYASYGESSRVPTPVELTCADPEDPCRLPNAFVSDPPLAQVVAQTVEAGMRGGAGPWRWSMASFSTTASEDIIFVSSGTRRGEGHFENVARTMRRGIEASGEFMAPRWSLFATYTAQHARFGQAMTLPSRQHPLASDGDIRVREGSRLPGVPVHSGKAGIALRASGRLEVSGFVRAQSGAFLRGDESNALAPLPAFAIVSVEARYSMTPRLALVGQAQNLSDANAYSFGILGDPSLLGEAFDDGRFVSPGAPRAAWGGVEVTF
jgi:hypothetical protein